MSPVIPIHGGRRQGEPVTEIVETLRGLLERAERGELMGLVYGTVSDNGTLGTGWDGAAGTRAPVASLVLMLHHRYAAALMAKD